MFNMTMRVYDGPPKNRRRRQATAEDSKRPQGILKFTENYVVKKLTDFSTL